MTTLSDSPAVARGLTRERLASVPMPPEIEVLPRNVAGYPIPFFAATIDGERDFRVLRPDIYQETLNAGRCWVCGMLRTPGLAFVIGPMCVVNRVSADGPSHLACAVYAAKVCPFLANPTMVRRDRGLPESTSMPGVPILRNPGVCAVYVTGEAEVFKPDPDGPGYMFQLGTPLSVSWWAHGRPATRAEVITSIESGLPLLDAECDRDDDPAGARAQLAEQREAAWTLLPAV